MVHGMSNTLIQNVLCCVMIPAGMHATNLLLIFLGIAVL